MWASLDRQGTHSQAGLYITRLPHPQQVRGKAEEARTKAAAAQPAEAADGGAAGAAAEAGTSATGGSGGRSAVGGVVVPIRDMWAWKRACEAWPSVRALWQQRREAAGQPPLPGAGSGTEAVAVA